MVGMKPNHARQNTIEEILGSDFLLLSGREYLLLFMNLYFVRPNDPDLGITVEYGENKWYHKVDRKRNTDYSCKDLDPLFLVDRSKQRNDKINAKQRDEEIIGISVSRIYQPVEYAVKRPVQALSWLVHKHCPQCFSALYIITSQGGFFSCFLSIFLREDSEITRGKQNLDECDFSGII